MKKLFKRLRLKLGLFTRDELFYFSDDMCKKYHGYPSVLHSDIENFIHDLKNNL